MGVEEEVAPLEHVRLGVYWLILLTLPGAISSKTLMATAEDKVVTAAVNGPAPAPVEVLDDKSTLLLVARVPNVNWSAAFARVPEICLFTVIDEYCTANITPCRPPETSCTFTVDGLKLPIM